MALLTWGGTFPGGTGQSETTSVSAPCWCALPLSSRGSTAARSAVIESSSSSITGCWYARSARRSRTAAAAPVCVQCGFVAHKDVRRLGALAGGSAAVLGRLRVADGKGLDAALFAGGNPGAEGAGLRRAQHNGAVGAGEVVQEQLLHLAHRSSPGLNPSRGRKCSSGPRRRSAPPNRWRGPSRPRAGVFALPASAAVLCREDRQLQGAGLHHHQPRALDGRQPELPRRTRPRGCPAPPWRAAWKRPTAPARLRGAAWSAAWTPMPARRWSRATSM